MIIRFTVANFRSIKDEQTLDFTAGSSTYKKDNIIEHGDLRLLRSVVLYGANASGKSNLIRAFFSFQKLILDSTDLKKGDIIPELFADPFLLDRTSKSLPTKFKIEFLSIDDKKYIYEVQLTREKVIYENLVVYETSQPSNLFLRENGEEFVKLFDKFTDQNVDKSVLANNLFLSKVGNSPNKQIGDLYLYFKNIEVWNTANTGKIRELFHKMERIFVESDDRAFQARLSKLIYIADTGIDHVFVQQHPHSEMDGLAELTEGITSDVLKESVMNIGSNQTFGVHNVYEGGKKVGTAEFEFVRRQSTGTLAMFAIGGLIIHSLLRKMSTPIFLDEFDNSLHPHFCRFLIQIFNSPLVNVNKSQLIFATHETQLLDRNIFRKDQIWFSEKDSCGRSEFFSVADFKGDDNLREGIPFDKWYSQGKFGAIPKIKGTELLADYE